MRWLSLFIRLRKSEVMIMDDEFFGNVTWDSSWSGKITLANGKTAAFEIDIDETDESLIEAARNLLNFLAANESEIRHKIAVSAVELFGHWLENDPLSPEELAQKINLNNVEIGGKSDGFLSYTADDDLFAGHWIQVWIDVNGEIGEPDLWG
jgi:hypothetical protein